MKVFIYKNKILLSVLFMLSLLIGGYVLLNNYQDHKSVQTQLLNHGIIENTTGNFLVKRSTIVDLENLLSSKIIEAEEYLEDTKNLVDKYEITIDDTKPVTLQAKELNEQVLLKQNEEKNNLVTEYNSINEQKIKLTESEKRLVLDYQNSLTILELSDNVLLNETNLVNASSIITEHRNLLKSAADRALLEKQLIEEEFNSQICSLPEGTRGPDAPIPYGCDKNNNNKLDPYGDPNMICEKTGGSISHVEYTCKEI